MKLRPATSVLLGFVLAFAPFAIVACQSGQTPQAQVFATLQSAAVAIDSFRASYEQAAASGQIDAAKKLQCDRAYNRANDAIIAAARAARDGLNAQSPAEVQAAVKSFVELVTTLVPPKPRAATPTP